MVLENEIKKMFENRVIAVTGGLGSIGSAIAMKLLEYSPKEIRIIDNRETDLFYAINYFRNEMVKVLFGDVKEKSTLYNLLKDVDIVFHASAMKHVLICEQNPFEAVKTNVIGTQNLIEVCMEKGVDKMILISTDKAVNPINVMGVTKLLGERIVSAMHNIRNENDTKYGIVRFGNVLYSRGSVLEIWEKQLEKNEKITVTYPNMTRFFMKIPQCVDLIFAATYYVENGETFILKMPSVRIGDLAKAFLELKSYPRDHYEIIGVKEGEKIHEELLFESESKFLMENNEFFLRLPLYIKNVYIKHFEKLGFRMSKKTNFSSNDPEHLLSKEEINDELQSYY